MDLVVENVTWKAPNLPRGGADKLQFSYNDSPDRYRLLYSYGSTNINLATGIWTIARYLCLPQTPEARNVATLVLATNQLGDATDPGWDGVVALRVAMHAARLLFQITYTALNPGFFVKLSERRTDRFPRLFLTNRVARNRTRRDYQPFLQGELMPAAMTLIASCLQLRDQVFGPSTTIHSGRVDVGDPDSLADALNLDEEPDRAAIIGWLSADEKALERDDQRRGLSYRIFFNLACYYSRELIGESDRARRDELVTKARSCLQKSFAKCPHAERAGISQRARSTPALAYVRAEGPEVFDEMLSLGDGLGSSRPPAMAAPRDPDIELGRVPRLLLSHGATRVRAECLLSAMRIDGMMDHSKLRKANDYVARAEQRIAECPATLLPFADQDRQLLKRLLFLHAWLPAGQRSS
jgi:hypothetical protein